MSAATRRFAGASGQATRIISRHRKSKAWGEEWATASDSKPWLSSSVNLSGDAKGMGIVVLLTKREGHRYCCRVSMPSHDSLCLEKTDEGFTKWTSSGPGPAPRCLRGRRRDHGRPAGGGVRPWLSHPSRRAGLPPCARDGTE